MYFKRSDKNISNVVLHSSYCFLSPYIKHNTIVVYTFLSRLIPEVKKICPNPEKIHYFTDGCVGQYKNKYNFLNICKHRADFGVNGIYLLILLAKVYVTVKRATTKASLLRTFQHQILSPEDMYKFCCEHFMMIKLNLLALHLKRLVRKKMFLKGDLNWRTP